MEQNEKNGIVLQSKQERDEAIIDYLDSLLAKGIRRQRAIRMTALKFNISRPMTVYNTELRVRKREWEVRHGKREA